MRADYANIGDPESHLDLKFVKELEIQIGLLATAGNPDEVVQAISAIVKDFIARESANYIEAELICETLIQGAHINSKLLAFARSVAPLATRMRAPELLGPKLLEAHLVEHPEEPLVKRGFGELRKLVEFYTQHPTFSIWFRHSELGQLLIDQVKQLSADNKEAKAVIKDLKSALSIEA